MIQVDDPKIQSEAAGGVILVYEETILIQGRGGVDYQVDSRKGIFNQN